MLKIWTGNLDPRLCVSIWSSKLLTGVINGGFMFIYVYTRKQYITFLSWYDI